MFCSAWPQPKPWPGEAGGWGDFAKCMLPCYVYSALRYFFLSCEAVQKIIDQSLLHFHTMC